MWKKDDSDTGPQNAADMLATYKGAVEEFSSNAAAFLAHIPLLIKARDAYQRAMAVSTQLRQILDKGDETLRLLMGQMEQAANVQLVVAAADKKRAEAVKVETATPNGDKAEAARA
jgi:hypothetical protein